MARLRVEEEAGLRRDRIAWTALLVVGGIITALIALLFAMAFLGNPEQRDMALSILRVFGIGAAGAGIAGFIGTLVRRVLRVG